MLHVTITETTIDAEDVTVGMRIRQLCSAPYIVKSISPRTVKGYLRFMDPTGAYHYYRTDAKIIYMYGA